MTMQSGSYRDLIGGRNLVVGRSGGDDLHAIFGAIDLVGAGEATTDDAKQALMEHLASKNATGVVNLPPTKSRRYPCGFPTTTVAAGGTATVIAQPQIPFRGERLVVPSDIAGALLITDVKVGKNSQLAAGNPLPARAYTEQGWGIDMHLDTADISQFVQLQLLNTSAHDLNFNALMLGRAVE